jgi:glycine/D-amino acid oxidase-like deaminating enzyme
VSARPDLLVVGAGLTGLFTALFLKEAGLEPLLVPTRYAADFLPPLDDALLPPWQRPRVIGQLEARSLQLLPARLTELSQDTGVDLALSRRDLVALSGRRAGGSVWGESHPGELVSGALADFEPQLAEGHRSALCCRGRRSLRVDRLERALRLALLRQGVRVHERSAAARLDVAGNIVLGVELESGEGLRAEATVLAADQATGKLLYDSGLVSISGLAEPGQALQFAPSSARLQIVVADDSLLLAPRLDGRLVALGLPGGSDEPSNPEGLRHRVHGLLPGLGRHDLELIGHLPVPHPGLRASIGAYPGVRGFWVNTGHDPFGPLIAPAAAEFLAEQLSGGPAVRELAVTFSH